LALAAAIVLIAGAGFARTQLARSGGSSASPVLRLVGAARGSERIDFGLLLHVPGARRLNSSLAGIEDPRSPSFHHFIAPGTFGVRFGLSNAQLAGLERAVRARKLLVTATYPQRTELAVSGTVQTVQRLFGVHLLAYQDRAGHQYVAPTSSPQVPAAFAGSVDGVFGLDTRPRWQPRDVPLGGLTPNVAATAYDISALHNAGFTGQGERIAVISFSAFDPSDPAAFAAKYGISGPEPRVVPVDGGTNDTSGATETNLDVDVIREIAPGAQILVYEAPNSSSSYADMINRIVADRSSDIISSSWGLCELGLDPTERAAESRALSAAVAAGVSMFAASGDSGAYDCQQGDLTDHRLSVDWPASSANAISVGGTRLYIGADGSYQRETAWEDQLSAAGGGGGVSTGDARPSWQSGTGVRSNISNGRRQVPDVSADADPGTPWSIYARGQPGDVGGTSAAAPFWAASMLLITQYAAGQGVGRLGYVNPILYALASSPQPFAPLHDVTGGGNRFYPAGTGWDAATGLGSPDVYALARDMVRYLRAHPAR
jgi:subtilase family serine protease